MHLKQYLLIDIIISAFVLNNIIINILTFILPRKNVSAFFETMFINRHYYEHLY